MTDDGIKLRLKGASLQDLEALVRHLGHDKGESGAGATARRLFRWMYHKVRKTDGLLVGSMKFHNLFLKRGSHVHPPQH